jgi:hypothetical protein
MSMILDGSNGVTFNDASLQGAAASPYVLKNRIINGDMVINQRAFSGTPTDGAYTLDRWYADLSPASKFTVSQNAGSVTPPVGFVNYLGVTSSSAYSISATDIFTITQRIEGYNISDFSWGTASAKTVTLSFWVRSSLTGTFGGALRSNGNGRCYPFTYSIPTANTWTQISVTIAGETSGTWLSTNGNGVSVTFGLGVGSTYSGTAGAWSSNLYFSATGATSVVGTNGATWYVTGVQLEIGSSATPFERRLYTQELANCQRYYYKLTDSPAESPTSKLQWLMAVTSALTSGRATINFKVSMRAAPTCTAAFATAGGTVVTANTGIQFINTETASPYANSTTDATLISSFTASAEL